MIDRVFAFHCFKEPGICKAKILFETPDIVGYSDPSCIGPAGGSARIEDGTVSTNH
jgi:hypothetical protein